MPPLEIVQIPVLSDNYVYLVHDADSGQTAVVDPAEAAPVQAALQSRGWSLSHILCTHHHGDHIGGVAELKAASGALVLAGKNDHARIPAIDRLVEEGDTVAIGAFVFRVIDVPGHTLAHVAYYCPKAEALFCGDTLFSLGCGRLFEGSAQQMYTSLGKLARLPATTRVYCAHEYTQSNGRFALTVDRENLDLVTRLAEVADLRSRNLPTVPSTLEQELAANPFLRAPDARTFESLRQQKDIFR